MIQKLRQWWDHMVQQDFPSMLIFSMYDVIYDTGGRYTLMKPSLFVGLSAIFGMILFTFGMF